MDGITDLPSIFLVIGLAFLTILIPVAIAIFRHDQNEFEILDKNVILDHIIKAKFLLIYLALIFLPFLLWNDSGFWLRLIEMIFWVIGVIFMTRILFNSYRWMKGDKFSLRFEYLRNLKDNKDLEASWRSVWQTENINAQNEQEFFEIFASTLNRILNEQ